MIGRTIDELARRNEWGAVDRLIMAHTWCAGAYNGRADERCFVGHLYDFVNDFVGVETQEMDRINAAMPDAGSVPARFDKLVHRFGLDRTVSAIKKRCGKHTAVRLPIPAPLEASVNV